MEKMGLLKQCRPFENLTAARHQIMVTVNEMDRMDCPYRHNALGWTYQIAD